MRSMIWLSPKRVSLVAAIILSGAPASSLAQLPKLWVDDTLASQRLNQTRRFSVALPVGYEDPEAQSNRYPVLIVLNVNPGPLSTLILSVREQNRLGVWAVPELIVVNIPADNTRDLYPPLTGAAGRLRPTAGGADAFGDFLVTELVPLLRSRYRTLPYVIIGGQSAGGQFAIRAFARYPETFQGAITPSPALEWNENAVIDRYAEQIARRKAPGRLYVAAGGYDPATLAAAESRFAARLKALKPMTTAFEFRKFPDDGHSSIEIPGYVDGLRWLFKPVSLARNPLNMLAKDVGDSAGAPPAYERLKRQYAEGARIFGMPEGLPDEFLRTMATLQGPFREPNILDRRMCDDDITWHPDNAYAYTCLGQLLLRQGDTVGARNAYDRGMVVARKAGWTSTAATLERRLRAIDSAWSTRGKP
jgi:predicted alpha/beta superfamily hydrolase